MRTLHGVRAVPSFVGRPPSAALECVPVAGLSIKDKGQPAIYGQPATCDGTAKERGGLRGNDHAADRVPRPRR
ncbi:hypothetical protein, partial [Nocardia mexicana]|uniref:hypothetical protein n=1 Tax=Nocardia mexicana TaxID=279262 RepID=UPI001C3FEA6C